MDIVNLVVALALMGGLWVAVVKLLAASIRRTDRLEAAALPAAGAALRRSPPANRELFAPLTGSGTADSRTVDNPSTMKDLLA